MPAKADAAGARLKFLEEVGLVHREGRDYHLAANWQESLEVSRRFASYLGAAKQLKFTPPSLLRLYSPEKDGRIVGRVSAIGRIDELSNNNYILLESIDGRAFYVPLLRRPQGISVGDSIAMMKSLEAGSTARGKHPSSQSGRPSTASTYMSLLDVRYARLPDEKLKSELARLAEKRSGFGLQL